MRTIGVSIAVLALLAGATHKVQAQAEKTAYPAMAPISQYLMEEKAEIALARSAAPASVSNDAEVMVLTAKGYATAVLGTNGFLCIVERSWANSSDNANFWNPKVRAPNCFNAPAARTFVPIFLMKTRWVLEGKSPAEIGKATTAALDKKELPALEAGAMCYMMSKQQYLNDEDINWYPHLMMLAPGEAANSWGANMTGSPVLAAHDAEERVTIFMVVVGKWSDGTPGPMTAD